MKNTKKPHAAMLASPGMGHVIPVIQLGKRLAGLHGFHVTIFVLEADAASAQSQFLNSPDCSDAALVDVICLPPPDISGLVDPSASFGIKILAMMREAVPTVRSKIAEMQHKPTALIVDLLSLDASRLANEFNMLSYLFIASNARFVGLMMYFPTLDKDVREEHIVKKRPLAIPGCEPLRFEDTFEIFRDPSSQYKECVPQGLVYTTVDGIIVNTWDDMEPKTLKSLQDPKLLGRTARVPIYPIGPLYRPVDPSKTNHPVLDWLSKQPDESVLYISFGSGGSLSAKQLTELAWGLELSQQRFVWVVRPPVDGLASSAYVSVNSGEIRDGMPDYLPEEFASRTLERGLVVPSWAPQAEVLAHPAVGGFLTHCGWNSILESVVSGVPMIAWPLFAEQMTNATLLNEELGIAVRSRKLPSEGVILRVEIETLVRRIMVEEEGCEMRKKVKKLKDTAEKSLSCDGGSAHESLSRVAEECLRLLKTVTVRDATLVA